MSGLVLPSHKFRIKASFCKIILTKVRVYTWRERGGNGFIVED